MRTKVSWHSFLVVLLLLGTSGGSNGSGRGNAQVGPTWNARVGATSVNRSTTSGGSYTAAAASMVTNDPDTGLADETPYFYVPAAVDSADERANAAQTLKPPAPVPRLTQKPPVPTGLSTSAGNAQVALSWSASTGATSYNVKRSTTSGGPYTQIDSPTATDYTDAELTNGRPYFYVVSAVNSAGQSANSTQASATPELTTTEVQASVDALVDRHPISRYVYGGNFPQDAAHVTDSGMTIVRWGGDAASRYNWLTGTQNTGADWYFSDFLFGGFNNGSDSNSTQWIHDVLAAGSNPLMTMIMLDWVSKAPATEANGQFYSFSVAKYGAQCATDPEPPVPDAGDGLKTDCATAITGNDPHDANVPLLDTASSPCPPSASGNCTGSLYRNAWAAALATAFNTSPSALHFYDMDNEPDLWTFTHRDVHPNPTGYEELRDTFLTEARNLKSWDPAAVRLGPIGCCWWYYWNGANNNDKGAHGNIDQFPWFLNEVYWRDLIDNTRSLDMFDVHAYPDGPDTSGFTPAENQALTLRIYRDYWDPAYVSESGSINQIWATSIQPLPTIPFRIPRLRAMINTIYPNTPLSITEWSANFAGESDFSTALADADAYGIIGRERVYLASRWGAALPANPNYQALKLYRNYDGKHSAFGTMSISATHNADPDLFSVYASLSPSGSPLTLMVINKDPYNAAQVTFALNNFKATAFTSHTLSQASPSSIVASASRPWSATQTFPAYSATLLVATGAPSIVPAAEWDLNPDTILVPAGGSVNLAPKLLSGASVTLTSARFDSGGGFLSISEPKVTAAENGAVSVEAGGTSGFYHFTVTSQDSSGASQTQGGWIAIGNPSATLANNGTPASGAAGKQVTLSVTLNPEMSIGYPGCYNPPCAPSFTAGASVLFTVNAGSLSGGVYPVKSTPSTMQQVAVVDANGNATVTLTLPATSGHKVNVTAEGPYALGHPVLPLTVTAE
ncbi:MAG: glycoside hydrolase family 44 protein [Terriglobia bacterium]